jgi:type VI secretion system protein ImpK
MGIETGRTPFKQSSFKKTMRAHAVLKPNNLSKPKPTVAPLNQNQLITSADKLFSAITKLKRQKKCPDVAHLQQHLLEKIQKFQTKIETLGYDADSILIARYALSACLDETITKTQWGKTAWKDLSLLQKLQPETNADENFFIILDRVCQVPNKFIDIIELMYIVLSLGFEGKFQHQIHEESSLKQTINNAYQIIRAQRGEVDKSLSPSIIISQKKPLKNKKQYFPVWIMPLIAIIIIAGIYVGFNYLLKTYSDQFGSQAQSIPSYQSSAKRTKLNEKVI